MTFINQINTVLIALKLSVILQKYMWGLKGPETA